MDLKCRKLNCKYNNFYTCVAKAVSISPIISCESFELDPNKKVRDVSRCMFEEAPTYAPYREKKKMRIACKAECLFNEQGVCVANGLTVNPVDECPLCITHIKP